MGIWADSTASLFPSLGIAQPEMDFQRGFTTSFYHHWAGETIEINMGVAATGEISLFFINL